MVVTCAVNVVAAAVAVVVVGNSSKKYKERCQQRKKHQLTDKWIIIRLSVLVISLLTCPCLMQR